MTIMDEEDNNSPSTVFGWSEQGASPRSFPYHSCRSSIDFGHSLGEAESNQISSGEQSPVRGRTLVRTTSRDRRTSRATGRRKAHGSDLNIELAQGHLLSRDPSAEPEKYDDSLLEPLPFEAFRSSLSEELHRAATHDSSIDLTMFSGHRDTFALMHLRGFHNRALELPLSFFKSLVQYIDFETYRAARLSCRDWSAGLSLARPVVLPPVCRLPTEILENLYALLSPVDFNAARHTCRAWMIASLEGTMLTRMLKRGSWLRAARRDAVRYEESIGPRKLSIISQDWLLSKRLATECSLGPAWTGNGLPRNQSSDPKTATLSKTSGLVLTSVTDFSELKLGYNGPCHRNEKVELQFTVSSCQRYLLVVQGCMIYVFSLRYPAVTPSHQYGGHLQPYTSIICPSCVLAVSMDTTSGRFAVAALLEGRVGLVCDLQQRDLTQKRTSSTSRRPYTQNHKRSSLYSSCFSSDRIMTEAALPLRPLNELTFFEINGPSSLPTSWLMDDCLDTLAPLHLLSTQGITLETGPRVLYRNVCSDADPPRSVAICPQRRCVAFGCAAGLELHWIDALTGQDLNRWFPLSIPSDVLHFLPQRLGIDSAKKLRLVSSAAHPSQKSLMRPKSLPCEGEENAGNPWHDGLDDDESRDSIWPAGENKDHFKAVPISDGWHILFTDMETNQLCLGRDPLPGQGTSKLLRDFMFVGPGASVPTVYCTGSELGWGVRVAAGYGDQLWLFVIPPDIFFSEDQNDKANSAPDAGVHHNASPIEIKGAQIGIIPNLTSLAVDSSEGDLTIWAFSAGDTAYVFQLAGSDLASVLKRAICRDGTMSILSDADGDVPMQYPSPVRPATVDYFNGTGSAPSSPSSHINGKQPDERIVDADGDTSMLDPEEDEGYASDGESAFVAAGGAFALHVPPLWDWSAEDSEWVPDYLQKVGKGMEDEGMGVDVVEACRVEFEILGG